MIKYLFLTGTLVFTVVAQIILKWQVMQLSGMPTEVLARLKWGLVFLLRPWILFCFVCGFLAFVCWIAALREMPLSRAYPFMGISFILVAWLSSIFFGELLSPAKLLGTFLVIVGLIFASQG